MTLLHYSCRHSFAYSALAIDDGDDDDAESVTTTIIVKGKVTMTWIMVCGDVQKNNSVILLFNRA